MLNTKNGNTFTSFNNNQTKEIFMKTKTGILLLFMVLIMGATAQTPAKRSFLKFGPKFGVDLNANINNLGELPSTVSDVLKNNYQFGAFAQIGRRLYIQPEFYYAVQTISESENLERFRVPIHVGLHVLDIGLISLHLTGGVLYEQLTTDPISFVGDNINYQIGVGVNVLGFITTDIRYTLRKGVSLADQISDFSTNGGMINATVGLRL